MAKYFFLATFVLSQVLLLNAFDANRFAQGSGQPQIGNHGNNDKGSWGVSVNKDKGRGPQIRTEGQIKHTSKDGNWQSEVHGHHEAGKGRKPSYGVGGSIRGKWRRDLSGLEFKVPETLNEEPEFERQKRSPSQQPSRGSIDITVNKDKGRGPQVRTEANGNIYTSPNGRWTVDGQGHHEAGRGRKPDYGGSIRVQGRFRREADEGEVEKDVENVEAEDTEQTRLKRSPSQQPSRGSIDVSVNKDKGRGPQIRTEASGNIYTSPNGRWTVDGQGHHEAGRGRKPDYGGGIRVQGRFRREANEDEAEVENTDAITEAENAEQTRLKRSPSQQPSRGSIDVSVNKDKGRGPQIRTEASGNIYTSPNGRWTVDGQGHHEAGRGRKPDYGGGIRVQGRFRREANEDDVVVEDTDAIIEAENAEQTRLKRSPSQQPSRGSIDVSVNKDKGRGPQIRTEASGNIYTSPNGRWTVDGQGHHEAGRGRKPDYGGGIRVQGRFRREANEDDVVVDDTEAVIEAENAEQTRLKRSPSQQPSRGSIDITVNKDKGRGPQVRTEASGNIYTSPNGRWTVDGQGHHEAGRGRKPDYGGGIRVQGRFRREIEEEENNGETENVMEEENIEQERSKRSPKDDKRGSISVSANKDKGRGPQIRTEGAYNIHTSKNGNWKVDAGGYHEAGRGRKPSYGGQVSVHGRF